MEMTWAVAIILLLFFAWIARNEFVTRRFTSRFGTAFLDELKETYPESASLLPPDLGKELAYILVNNKTLAKELNALEAAVSKRPEIGGKSYAHFDLGYSRETQELIVDLLKKKIELASKFFNCLPTKVRSLINKKAETDDKAEVEAYSGDEEFEKDRTKEKERAKFLGLDTWRYTVLMNVYDIAGRANLVGSR
jgi:hypothetical protein